MSSNKIRLSTTEKKRFAEIMKSINDRAALVMAQDTIAMRATVLLEYHAKKLDETLKLMQHHVNNS